MSHLTFQGPTASKARGAGYPSPTTSMTDEVVHPGSAPESEAGPSNEHEQQHQQHQQVKRTRILLSCAACRMSKLKCDRQQPCSQCLKKGRADGCAYAPKPQKPVLVPRSMTARLKRLEAMVRDMMDAGGADGDGVATLMRERQRLLQQQGMGDDGEGSPIEKEETHGQVVFGRATTYVGATHFMAMLDDIEDLKSYFDDEEVPEVPPNQSPEPSDTDMLLISSCAPMSKQEIISMLPNKAIVDRLIQRYFGASSPAQPLVHRPTFVKEYNEFWKDPYNAPMEWIALLLMILALGTFFSIYVSPHEVENAHSPPPMDVYRRYRAAAGWALVAAKYTSPSHPKMQAYLLYVVAEFVTNRASSANCYVLSSVGMRLMLQMGLHRDPDKLPNISPFEGEMRRRMWHLATQIELLVSFHMGLPSMLNGLESDIHPQSNLTDDEIYHEMAALPTPRPDTEATQMTYARWKSQICAIFGKIAAQTNSITVPAYSEVMRLDHLLEEKWKQVPSFMKVKSYQESIADPPAFIHQRFGLASLYQKSRCVLHRRYLTEAVPKKEHAYSRRVCLEAAMAMLHYQDAIHLRTLPGGVMREHGWFLAAIATYDFLIAAMIIYVLHQSETYLEDEAYSNWSENGEIRTAPPTRNELLRILRRSHQIWIAITQDSSATKKAADILETMLKRIDSAEEMAENGGDLTEHGTQSTPSASFGSTTPLDFGTNSATNTAGYWQARFATGPSNPNSLRGFAADGMMTQQALAADVSNIDGTPWLDLGAGMIDVDWNTFDSALGANNNVNFDMLQIPGWGQQANIFPGSYNS
ncbi:fungal-specific transcription factor domain-containing protein [Cercophora newfieldiana]|uniref:Fungal-specific transcription factor domain-containing protein n=1 Tax=Cercophora newfieldiana TaxID=92897 RepID=A0AA39YI10_9PEZI|nr:fungal-specific transcription factor domain-containing protein [Cercophora newfieldiana]